MTDQPNTTTQLETENQELRQQLTTAQRRIVQVESILDLALDGITVAGVDYTITYANAAFRTMSGFGDAAVGLSFLKLYSPDVVEQLRRDVVPQMRQSGYWQGSLNAIRPDGTQWVAQLSARTIVDPSDGSVRQVAIFRDITAQMQADEEQLTLQQRLIDTQQAALRELSTPLIPLADGVIVMPLVGAIDANRAQQIMETLLEGIGSQQSETAILDITGVKVVDTQVADALLRAARAAQLLGAQVVLTGISAEVAQALVGLGADLSGVVTRSNLQSGIAYAMQTTKH